MVRHTVNSAWMKKMLAWTAALGVGGLAGCEVDSFFDPSKTGRFMYEPTTMPILDRIDVIEMEPDPWGHVTSVMPEDLLPNDLSYVLAPGDVVTIEIYELQALRMWGQMIRRVDATGRVRLHPLGEFMAAGRTVQQFEDDIIEAMRDLHDDPQVSVVVEDPRAFTFTVYGFIGNPGQYALRQADLRLIDALATVGGVPMGTERVFVIRQVLLSDEVMPIYQRDRPLAPETPGMRPAPPREPRPIDIEELIEQLEDRPPPGVRPGMMSADGAEGAGGSSRRLLDVDDLEPVRIPDRPAAVDVDELRDAVRPTPAAPGADDTFIFIEERNEWVRTRPRPGMRNGIEQSLRDEPELILERIIEIPYQRLARGESAYNIVVRPNDRIYVETPDTGFVYISGEVFRPGVFNLPPAGAGPLTLSRVIAAAGDFGPIAIPERVDITRMIGPNREATVRVNLAAIRRRTEPDLIIKANDHIHIGTSWVATPLAIIRNGFRTTYGFGFLLDRNFGSDVFGPPPVSRFQ